MSLRSSVKQFLKMCGHAMSGSVHERLDTLERNAEGIEIHLNSLEEGQASLLHAAIHSIETLHAMQGHKLADTSSCSEAALVGFLYSYVPSRKGAALSAKAEELLTANGFELCDLEDDDSGLACAELNGEMGPQVRKMRTRGYPWNVVVYRSATGAGYYANQLATVPDSRGAAIYFREYEVFAQALAWCAATLAPTYFRPGSKDRSGTIE